MNSKLLIWIGAAGLLAVAAVPLAVAAAASREPTLTTYTTNGRVERSARRAADVARTRVATIVLDDTFVWGTIRTLRGSAARAAPSVALDDCPDWRLLAAGPRARAAEPFRVRACVAQHVEAPIAAAAAAAPVAPRIARPAMTFVYAPGEPARQP